MKERGVGTDGTEQGQAWPQRASGWQSAGVEGGHGAAESVHGTAVPVGAPSEWRGTHCVPQSNRGPYSRKLDQQSQESDVDTQPHML